jgi:endonuclease YncB( thermonuclease family)
MRCSRLVLFALLAPLAACVLQSPPPQKAVPPRVVTPASGPDPGPARPLPAGAWTGRCVGVTDGDTLAVLRDGRAVKVRLAGIDAPEKAQPFGQRAKQALDAMVYGQAVTVDPRDTDRYGRTVADVRAADGRHVNAELVAAGMAWWYRRYAPGDRELEQAEARARAARAGLWADAHPVAPWDWRHGGEREPTGGPPSAAPPSGATQSARAPAAGPTAAPTVYVTPTGRRYHREGCGTMRGNGRPVPQAEAQARGLTPCAVCGG